MTDATIITSDDDGPCVSEPMIDPDESGPLPRTLAVSSSSLLSQPSLYSSSSGPETIDPQQVPIWTAPGEVPTQTTTEESPLMTATTPTTQTPIPILGMQIPLLYGELLADK